MSLFLHFAQHFVLSMHLKAVRRSVCWCMRARLVEGRCGRLKFCQWKSGILSSLNSQKHLGFSFFSWADSFFFFFCFLCLQEKSKQKRWMGAGGDQTFTSWLSSFGHTYLFNGFLEAKIIIEIVFMIEYVSEILWLQFHFQWSYAAIKMCIGGNYLCWTHNNG